MKQLINAERWDAAIQACRQQFYEIYDHSILAEQALGLRHTDIELVRIGSEILAELQLTPPQGGVANDGPDVYLATQLPDIGGHSRLLHDFVDALAPTNSSGKPVLLVTDIHLCPEGPLPARGVGDLGFLPDQVHILQGESPAKKLAELFLHLFEIRPRRLFLFHHPDDPVPVAVIQEGLGASVFLVHHADGIPGFGLHVPGVRAIELHPPAAAMDRLIGVPNDLLMLTAPDPGPRPHGFRLDKNLTTITSGRLDKFIEKNFTSYPALVRVILCATQGRHIHIGPLDELSLASIASNLAEAGVAADRFVHVPYVPNMAAALWEYRCDVYISSYPVEGGRVNAEVAASGTPIIAYELIFTPDRRADPLELNGIMIWKTLDELSRILHQCRDAAFLLEKSTLARRSYEKLHYPSVFSATLHRILAGKGGIIDPLAESRDKAVLLSLISDLSSAVLQRTFAGCESDRRLRQTRKQLERNLQTLEEAQQALSLELESVRQSLADDHQSLVNDHQSLVNDHQSLAQDLIATKIKFASDLASSRNSLSGDNRSLAHDLDTAKIKFASDLDSFRQSFSGEHQSLAQDLDAAKIKFTSELDSSHKSFSGDHQSLAYELETLRARTRDDRKQFQEKLRGLNDRLSKIQEERTALRRAKGWRARLRRWFTKI